jgi:hypothetical protein
MDPNTVVTTWKPDTCNCTLHYSWDRNSAEDSRVHTYYSPEQATTDGISHLINEEVCEDHVAFGTSGADNYNQVLSENQTKNQFLAYLADQANIVDDAGNPTYHVIPFSFDSQRVLTVALDDVATAAASLNTDISTPSLPQSQQIGKVGALQQSVSTPVAASLDAPTLQSYADTTFGSGKVKVS